MIQKTPQYQKKNKKVDARRKKPQALKKKKEITYFPKKKKTICFEIVM